MKLDHIYNENCLTGLAHLPAQTVQMCVTSPPYYGLRDYGHPDQLGLEETPEAYVANMVQVFREVRRVLKNDGVLWLNLGDSYANNGVSNIESVGGFTGERIRAGKKGIMDSRPRKIPIGLKPKDLIGIPWMVAFALRADGWYLRQDIIWHKPNPMPESVTDRCTKAHEYIFLLSKSERYFYAAEAIAEKSIEPIRTREKRNGESAVDTKKRGYDSNCGNDGNRNRRSVWTIATQPYPEAHFATFPPDLIIPCIKAGSRPGDIILDPFMGSGTTAEVALRLQRHYIGYEINPQYIQLAEKRLRPHKHNLFSANPLPA